MKKIIALLLSVSFSCFAGNVSESPAMESNQYETAYFLSASIPEKTLASLIRSAESRGIPVYFNGLIDDSVDKTAKYILYLVRKYKINGIEIDPNRFEYYGIKAVPALVKRCGEKFDIIYGSVAIKESLELIESEGECANE
ncbi:type-F conjugative transfer system pilin assembly protein TrbC [Morganella morganii subsp. morganii]|uniref:type-F conjugative transfer system pilin assembly protein TrbC n=1 Tax=Morganella morganii TaxID=582 RepID=UPI001BD9174A|nr:type-F conjugative transfer system pilin assembly protein TrbC [Morganella morganii]MBT0513757.1 type-F conjugative transfer system pilin assembly protein TrbC [Morganella morganii subsp. morganii]UNJ80389.1 hypothetical protein [Morganella morganii]